MLRGFIKGPKTKCYYWSALPEHYNHIPFFISCHSQCMYTCTWMPKSGGITSLSLVHTMCNGWSPVLTAHVTTILSPSFLFSKEKASITGGSVKRNMLKFSTVHEKTKSFIQTQLCIVEAWRLCLIFGTTTNPFWCLGQI